MNIEGSPSIAQKLLDYPNKTQNNYKPNEYSIIINSPQEGKQTRIFHSSKKKKGISTTLNNTYWKHKVKELSSPKQHFAKKFKWCGVFNKDQEEQIEAFQKIKNREGDHQFQDQKKYPIQLQSRVIKDPLSMIKNLDIKKFLQRDNQRQSQLARSFYIENSDSLSKLKRTIVQRDQSSTKKQFYDPQYPSHNNSFDQVLNSDYKIKINFPEVNKQIQIGNYSNKKTLGHTQKSNGFRRTMEHMQVPKGRKQIEQFKMYTEIKQ